MRRLMTNREMRKGEFAVVRFLYKGESTIGICLHDPDGSVFLLTNVLDGCYSLLKRDNKLGYRCSWVLPSVVSSLPILQLIQSSRGDDMCNADGFEIDTTPLILLFSADGIEWLFSYLDTIAPELPDITVIDEADDSEVRDTGDIPTEWIAEHYAQRYKYRGQHEYHHSHSTIFNEPLKRHKHLMGIELEVEFDDEDDRENFTNMESNWFQRESDGSLEEYGCEIVTIPLLPEDAKSVEFWQPLCSYLSRYASSWDTGRCGLHVHIGREILGTTEEQKSETLGRLLYVYHHCIKDTRLNCKIYGRERGYSDRDGKTDVSNAVSVLGTDVLGIKAVRDKVKDSMFNRAHSARYFDINLQNSSTIEFRRGRGSIKADRIAMVAEYCERLCIYAKNTPWLQIGYADLCKFLKATASPKLKAMVEQWG